MAKIFRFRPESAIQVCLSEAQAQGLPVQMDAVRNGLTGLVMALYQKYGIGFSVDESSPYYQSFIQQFQGQQIGLRPPQAPAPSSNGPVVMAQAQANPWPPQPVQQRQQPQYPVYQQPQAQVPVMQPGAAPLPPLPPTAVLPGRPLPPLQPPPHMAQSGLRQGPIGPVPAQAPLMGSGELPSMTSSQPPVPSILE